MTILFSSFLVEIKIWLAAFVLPAISNWQPCTKEKLVSSTESHWVYKYILRTDPMPSCRWQTQLNPLVLLELIFPLFISLLLIYYGFWFCVYMGFLCMQMCVCLCIYVFLCSFFGFVSCSFVISCAGLFVFILLFFLKMPICFQMRKSKKVYGFGWVRRWLWSGRAVRRRNNSQNIFYGKKSIK